MGLKKIGKEDVVPYLRDNKDIDHIIRNGNLLPYNIVELVENGEWVVYE
jgi:hypothetical protein